MELKSGIDYITDNSDLLFRVHKVQYINDECYKVKGSIFNKRNGIHYETKNYKLLKSRIQHWRKA